AGPQLAKMALRDLMNRSTPPRMTWPAEGSPTARRGPVEHVLTALDRMPGLGGGITHLVFLSLFFGTSFALYLTVLRLRGPAVAFRTRISWDAAFPFTPWWVWIYLLPYLLGPLLTILMSRAAF